MKRKRCRGEASARAQKMREIPRGAESGSRLEGAMQASLRIRMTLRLLKTVMAMWLKLTLRKIQGKRYFLGL
jgi:hypothetical protein